jgi:ABC-type phosphate/phosphonate transport system ATPase subunit
VAVVASLHQVHLAVSYADRIIALRAGRVVEDAPAAPARSSSSCARRERATRRC